MHNDIPLKYYDIADEYATEAAEQVAESERDALAHYFQLLLTRLANNEEISEEAQQEMAAKPGSVRVALMMLRTSSISGEMNSLPQKPLW
jgi:hypothetical protein